MAENVSNQRVFDWIVYVRGIRGGIMSGNKDVYDMLLNYIGNTISSKTMNDTNCSSGDEKWNSGNVIS